MKTLPKLYRESSMQARRLDDPNQADGSRRFEVAISSETEIERSFWGDRYIEVLSHASDAVDLTRLEAGAAVLIDHGGDQVGVVESATIGADRILRGAIRFSNSPRGREIERDVEEGIRQNISVGYVVRKMVLKEEAKENGKGKLAKYLITRWQPVEVSIVSVPADITVGVGRSSASGEQFPVEEEGAMEPNKGAGDDPVDEKQARLKDLGEVARICTANGAEERIAKFIEDGKTSDQVAKILLMEKREATRRPSKAQPGSEALDMPSKDVRRYRYSRAIEMAAGMSEGSRAKFDGLEAEVHQELLKNKPIGLKDRGGIFVPLDLRTDDQVWQDREDRQKRALDSKTLTKGPETVFDVPGELIELLRARAAVVALGAQTLTGLSGPIGFPKQTGAMTLFWVGENPAADVTDSDPAMGLVTLQPKTLQGSTSYSRQLLTQSSIDIEAMVRNELAMGHALAVDRAAIHGQSAAGQPAGVYLSPDVQAQAFGSAVPTYALLVNMIGLVADKNATLGSLGWITTPLMAAKLLTVLVASAAGSEFIWTGTLETTGSGRIAGYRAVATNQVSKTMSGSAESGSSEHGIVFGNWADLVIGLFGSLELVVDPYRLKKRGLIEVTSFQMADLILRHGESFAKSTAATIA